MKKIAKKQGFALLELLLAILVAIGVPTYTSALENSRQRTDLANARALKSLSASEFMETGETWKSDKTFYLTKNGQDITTIRNEGMTYTSKKYGKGKTIEADVSVRGNITINCSDIANNNLNTY